MKRLAMIFSFCLLFVGKANAQWVTFDPTNLVQSIVNTTSTVLETSKTVSGMIDNFNETKKIYEQGKEFYDALKTVNDLVKDARKVQQTILLVGEISDIYVNSFEVMMTDDNFTLEELSAIAYGYAKLLEQSTYIVEDLQSIISPTSLSMSDKERMDMIDACYREVLNYRNLVSYFTNKNVSVSYLRARNSGNSDAIVALYSDVANKYW